MKIRDLLDKKYTKKVTQEIINSFRRAYAEIAKLPYDEITENRVIEIMSEQYERSAVNNSDNLYNMSKDQYDAAIRKMSASIRQDVNGFKYSYNQVDRQMLNILDQNNTLFIGKFFDNQLEPVIRAEMSKILTEQQTKKDTALSIAQMLKDKAGAYAYNYSKMIVETNGTWARSIGNTNAMEEAGVTEYEYLVTDDDLTSDICQALIGKTGTIENAITTRDQYLAMPTTSYEAGRDYLERVSPFIRAQGEGFSAGGKYYDKSQIENIPGIALPPFHPNCRTEIVIK